MRQAGKEKTVTKKNDNFIMLPTVDVCFKGLMYNPKVRKGFIAALLKADPASVRETILLPTGCGRNTRMKNWGSWMSAP